MSRYMRRGICINAYLCKLANLVGVPLAKVVCRFLVAFSLKAVSVFLKQAVTRKCIIEFLEVDAL